jgi:hypothetical protein
MPRPAGSPRARQPRLDPLEPRPLLSAPPLALGIRPAPPAAAEVGSPIVPPTVETGDGTASARVAVADGPEDEREEDAPIPGRDDPLVAQPVAPAVPVAPIAGLAPPAEPTGRAQAGDPVVLLPDRLVAAGPTEAMASRVIAAGFREPASAWSAAPGSDPVSRRPEADRPAGESGIEPFPRTSGPGEWPAPGGADLIADLLPVDRAILDDAADRVFEGLDRLAAGIADVPGARGHLPGALLLAAGAILAWESARSARGETPRLHRWPGP